MLLLILFIYDFILTIFMIILLIKTILKNKEVESYLKDINFELAILRKKWYLYIRRERIKWK